MGGTVTRRLGPIAKPISSEVQEMVDRFIERRVRDGWAVVTTGTAKGLTVWATKTDNQQERECQQTK